MNRWKKASPAALLIGFLLVFPTLVLAGPASIQVGVLPVVDTLPLLVGQQNGYFEQNGIDLKLVSFQSALERDAALQAGRLDGYFGDLLNTILLIRLGADIRIVTTAFDTNPDHRMFGIAAAPDSGIETLAQLKGKTVAISRATVIEYLLDRILALHMLGPGYVKTEEIKKIPIRLQLLLSNRLDAALLPEPLLTLAQIKGATVIADDRELSTCLTVIALSQKALKKDSGLAARFLDAYAKSVAAINADPESFKTLLVEKTRFPKPAKDRFLVPVFPKPGLPSSADIMEVWGWLLAKNMVSGDFSADDAVLRPAH